MGNQFSCEKGEHDFTEVSRVPWDGGATQRLYCRRCAWVREIPTVEWCINSDCRYVIPGTRHEAHTV